MRPRERRCGRPMQAHDAPGRPYDPWPSCGRPEGHPPPCASEAAWRAMLERNRRYYAANRDAVLARNRRWRQGKKP